VDRLREEIEALTDEIEELKHRLARVQAQAGQGVPAIDVDQMLQTLTGMEDHIREINALSGARVCNLVLERREVRTCQPWP
jgi:hypothetical protein